MRSLTLYTRVILKGNHRGKGHNSTFAPLSCAITTNTKHLCPHRPPFPQLADILFADILFINILFINILFINILFINILFTDILFIDIPFINIPFIDILFIN